MKAVILAGGLGTRLQPFTFSIPKPLLPVGKRAIIEVAIAGLKASGIDHVIISTGYLAELLRAYCRDGRQWDVMIDYVHESKPLGTAGPLKLASGYIGKNEDFVLMNGDVITDLDFRDLLQHHTRNGFDVTMAYKEIVSENPFGVVEVHDGQLRSVHEKPKMRQLVNTGIYALNARCLELIPGDTFFTMPDLMTKIMNDKRPVGAFPISGYWKGLENKEDIEDAFRYLQLSGTE